MFSKKASILTKLQASVCNFIKKETLTQVFSCEFCEISKSAFSYRTSLVAAVKVQEDLKKEYEKKVRVEERFIPDPFKIPYVWLEEDKGMVFWPLLLYPDIFNYLMF